MKANISKIVGAALCLAGVNAHAGDEGGVIQFEIANEDRGVFADVFEPIFDPTVGENTSDGHLSWAWRISYTPNRTNPKWFRPIKEYLIWSSDDATVRSSSTLQQMAFMPDETRKNAGNKERPHAGFLAYEERLSLADPISTHTQRVDTVAMTVGIVGPLSGAEAVHEIVHDFMNSFRTRKRANNTDSHRNGIHTLCMCRNGICKGQALFVGEETCVRALFVACILTRLVRHKCHLLERRTGPHGGVIATPNQILFDRAEPLRVRAVWCIGNPPRPGKVTVRCVFTNGWIKDGLEHVRKYAAIFVCDFELNHASFVPGMGVYTRQTQSCAHNFRNIGFHFSPHTKTNS